MDTTFILSKFGRKPTAAARLALTYKQKRCGIMQNSKCRMQNCGIRHFKIGVDSYTLWNYSTQSGFSAFVKTVEQHYLIHCNTIH